MKALTLWQPWTFLMAVGAKRVETRCWETRYRGPIAIHAAKNIPGWLGDSRKSEEFHDRMTQILYADGGELVKGCVLCVATLTAIETTEKVRGDLSAQELLFGNYGDGRYAWFFEDVRRLQVPIPVKGNRLLWNWEPPADLERMLV